MLLGAVQESARNPVKAKSRYQVCIAVWVPMRRFQIALLILENLNLPKGQQVQIKYDTPLAPNSPAVLSVYESFAVFCQRMNTYQNIIPEYPYRERVFVRLIWRLRYPWPV